MKIKTLKPYQEQAVVNDRYHVDYARQQYDDATRCRRRPGWRNVRGLLRTWDAAGGKGERARRNY